MFQKQGLYLLLLLLFLGQTVSGQPLPTSSTNSELFVVAREVGAETAVSPTLTPLAYLPLITKPAAAALHPFEQEVVNLVNGERAQAGCGPLTPNAKLTAAARGHSQDMANNDFFSHTGSNGSSPGDRVDAQGYNWSTWGENIAAGYSSPAAVMNGWMNSSGHRQNILNCNYTEIGVGYIFNANDTGSVNYRHYWTQVFGRPR